MHSSLSCSALLAFGQHSAPSVSTSFRRESNQNKRILAFFPLLVFSTPSSLTEASGHPKTLPKSGAACGAPRSSGSADRAPPPPSGIQPPPRRRRPCPSRPGPFPRERKGRARASRATAPSRGLTACGPGRRLAGPAPAPSRRGLRGPQTATASGPRTAPRRAAGSRSHVSAGHAHRALVHLQAHGAGEARQRVVPPLRGARRAAAASTGHRHLPTTAPRPASQPRSGRCAGAAPPLPPRHRPLGGVVTLRGRGTTKRGRGQALPPPPALSASPPPLRRRRGGTGASGAGVGGERERAALPPRAWGTGDFNGSPAPRPRSRGQRQEAGRLTAGSRLGPVRAGAVPFAERRRGRCAAEQRDAALLPLPR